MAMFSTLNLGIAASKNAARRQPSPIYSTTVTSDFQMQIIGRQYHTLFYVRTDIWQKDSFKCIDHTHCHLLFDIRIVILSLRKRLRIRVKTPRGTYGKAVEVWCSSYKTRRIGGV